MVFVGEATRDRTIERCQTPILSSGLRLGRCQICDKSSPHISSGAGVCSECLLKRTEEALAVTGRIHEESRAKFGLPASPPREGLMCGICANNCKIPDAGMGYCGLVLNSEGRIRRRGGTPDSGILEWYYDALPTNCVAWWFCPGCTGSGFPKYSYSNEKPEKGYDNLAVFYGSCSFDCLFCQNWHYRSLAISDAPQVSSAALAEKATKSVSCICFFGGDPSPQMPHALETSRLALIKADHDHRILRVCWETNGCMNFSYLDQAMEFSLQTGGNMKFDIKFWDEGLARGICGVSNAQSLKNFDRAGRKYFEARPNLPVLTASTLLIPGYVNELEVGSIAEFISGIDDRIPYSLLAFSPQYVMSDLPATSREQALRCRDAALKHLKQVRIGNEHLLS